MMDAEQRFSHFIQQWAKDRKCQFIEQDYDGRESDHLIDGMAPDDVWGWLLPEGVTEKSDDYFGCIEWEEKDGHLVLRWETYEG